MLSTVVSLLQHFSLVYFIVYALIQYEKLLIHTLNLNNITAMSHFISVLCSDKS